MKKISFFLCCFLLIGNLNAAEGVLDFSSMSSSLALKPDSSVRLKYTGDGRQFGWSHASIVKATGDYPVNWEEAYPDGVIISYNMAPYPDYSATSSHPTVIGESGFVGPDESFEFGTNTYIDGNGSTLIFAGSLNPQFIISPGKYVILNNIKMLGITQKTFSLMSDSSQLIFGENVVWGLDESITFTRGKFQITGQNVFTIMGIGGQKRLKFTPADPTNTPMFNLGLGTLALQNIELTGLEYFAYQTSGNVIGALGLVGNTAVNIEKSTGMSFYIESLDNTFRLLENNVWFNGFLNYAETGDNVLHFDFVLRSPIETSDAKAQLEKGKVPVINFATNFIYLTSTNGIARIIFDDVIVKVNNQADAFIVIENSYLGANKLQVSGDPIWDASSSTAKNRFAVEAIELEAVGFTSNIIPEFGIPIIVDSGHHRSIIDDLMLTRFDLLDILNEERLRSAIELGKGVSRIKDGSAIIFKN
ncbi:MAG: hypothetical protein ABIA74_02975 [bacterium]